MAAPSRPVPGYLNPKEFAQATAHVVYEPPLAIGTVIRLGEHLSLEERTLRFEHATTGEPTELVLPQAEEVTIVGLDEWAEEKYNPETCQMEPTGRIIPYAYCLWETEQPPHIGDWDQFNEYCEREGITDQDAFLETEAGKSWLTGSHKVGDRRCFEIGRGLFHSALIGGQWIPVVYETVRTQVKPVLGWALESAAQTSYKGDEQASGHRGVARDAKGRLVRESNVERRRWTTTLAVEALAELDRISTETGEHRNEIVERLVMAAAPAPAAPAKGNSANRAADELGQVIEHACRKHGAEWPRTLTGEMVQRYGVTKQAIHSRKKTALRRLEQEVAA